MGGRILFSLWVFLCGPALLWAGEQPDLQVVQDSIGNSLVKVVYHLQYSEGESFEQQYPSRWSYYSRAENASSALEEERPLEKPGLVVAADTVLTEDLMLEDRFIASVEIEAAGRRYAAVPDRYAAQNTGLFMKTASPIEGAAPLTFDPEAEGPLFLVDFSMDRGYWNTSLEPLTGSVEIDRKGRETVRFMAPGLIVNGAGVPVGVAMSRAAPKDGYWKGSPLEWPAVEAADFSVAQEGIRRAAGAGLLQVTLNFRARGTRRFDAYYDGQEAASEIQTVGVLTRPGKVLVLSSLSRRETGRIESATVTCGGRSVELTIEGALRRYGALLASYEGELEGAEPVSLSPLDPSQALESLLVADRLNFDRFDREERFLRARFADVEIGFKNLLWPDASAPAGFLFTLDGRLAAAPMQARDDLMMAAGRYRRYDTEDRMLLMPSARLAVILSGLEADIDTGFIPQSEDEYKRLVWLGIETQSLDTNLARAHKASLATRGGEIGAIVAHVYPGSPADKAGVHSGDILLRFVIPEQARPANVYLGDMRGSAFPWAQLNQIPDVYFEQLPRPWPSRENDLTRFLTNVGLGKTITAVFLRDGAEREVDFTLEIGPKDFTSADRFEHEDLGLTVKNATYEVRRFYRMEEGAPGVVISDITPGSKASVAGLKPCEVITAVGTAPVHNAGEFEKALAAGGEVSLTVQRMSESRVVQVFIEGGATEDPGVPAGQGAPDEAPAPQSPQGT